MKEQLKQTIETLKKRVQYNLSIIRRNERKVREILEEPVSSDRSERLDEKYDINRKMLEENNDSLKIQLSLIKFLEKYAKQLEDFVESMENENKKDEPTQKEDNPKEIFEIKKLTKEDYYDLTINKNIEFNDEHPYFNDQDFYNDLMEYFTDIEDYEMCSKLVASHKKDDAFLN